VRTAAEVNQFLQRAEALYAENKLPEAVAEVQKARGVLEAGSGDEELARRVQQWLTDLDTAGQLEEIRLESFDQNELYWGHADYARVFRDYGIDVEALSSEEATARVAASQIRFDLVLALGNWAGKLRIDPQQQDPARWQRLRAIARAADPDPWKLRLYGADEARDVRTLRELADGADPARLRARTLAYLGYSLVNAGDAEAAVAFLRKAQRQHPGDFSINSALALSLSQLKPPQWDEEIAFRRVALGARPQSAWAHNTLGIALARKDRREEAIVEYREALRLAPMYAHVHYNLGNALLRQKKLDEAITSYKRAIEIDPKYAWAFNGLGVALKQKGELDNAIAAYKKAVEIDSKYALAHHNLGLALRQQTKLDGAIRCLLSARRHWECLPRPLRRA
jgi:tetratricopeptide (TPR) repeat protein